MGKIGRTIQTIQIPAGRETPTIQAAATMTGWGISGCLISRMARAAAKTKNKTRPKVSASRVGEEPAKQSVKPGRRIQVASPSQRPRALGDELVAAQRYALALESINENLYDWDIVNDTVYYAPGLYKILGIAPEQMRSPKDWTDRVHPDDQPLFKYTLAEHLKGNTPRFSMELRYRDGAGNWRWARQAGIAVRGPDGRAQPHGRRRRRHHRGQARRRGDDRLGRSAEGDEPLDLRAADRARHAWSARRRGSATPMPR